MLKLKFIKIVQPYTHFHMPYLDAIIFSKYCHIGQFFILKAFKMFLFTLEYRQPFLYVGHFNSIEVCNIPLDISMDVRLVYLHFSPPVSLVKDIRF